MDTFGAHSINLSGTGQNQLLPPIFSVANMSQVVTNSQVTITAAGGAQVVWSKNSNGVLLGGVAWANVGGDRPAWP